MNKELVYLDTNQLQRDMRIRMSKAMLTNLNAEAEAGVMHFEIYLSTYNEQIILRKVGKKDE